MEKSYKEIMRQISTFIFDVDGVLTDGTVTIFPNGEYKILWWPDDWQIQKNSPDSWLY